MSYKCNVCFKELSNSYSLKRHIKNNCGSNDSNVKCPECESTFGDHGQFVKHLSNEHQFVKEVKEEHFASDSGN